MSEYIDSGLQITIQGVPLQVNYHWDCFGDECTGYEVFLVADQRQETDIYDLLSDKDCDTIYETICDDVRSKV